jgi:hypothetical protein
MSFSKNEEHNMRLHQSSINGDILCGRNFGNRLGVLESAIFYYVEVWFSQGGDDPVQEPSPAGKFRPGNAETWSLGLSIILV